MLKELRRQRSKRVERQIKAFEKAKKQKSGTKRQWDAEERQEGAKTEKKAKRAAFVGQNVILLRDTMERLCRLLL